MSLAGQCVLVTGASGTVGSGIARAFLEAGATVIAPARSAGSKARVEGELGSLPGAAERLQVPVVDYGTLEGAHELARSMLQTGSGRVNHVVSIAGGMAPTCTLTEATPESLSEAVASRVAPHLWLAKAVVPLLEDREGSSYTVVTGILGEVCFWPSAALTAVTNAAVYGAVAALQAELKGRPVRVNELRIAAVIRRDADPHHPGFPDMPAAPVSRLASIVLGVATGQQRDEVLRVTPEQLAA